MTRRIRPSQLSKLKNQREQERREWLDDAIAQTRERDPDYEPLTTGSLTPPGLNLNLPDSEDETDPVKALNFAAKADIPVDPDAPPTNAYGREETLFHRVKRVYVDKAFEDEPRPWVRCGVCWGYTLTFMDDSYRVPMFPDPRAERQAPPPPGRRRFRITQDANFGVFTVCGHMFCQACWFEYMESIGERRVAAPNPNDPRNYPTYLCPLCRHSFHFRAKKCQTVLSAYRIPYWPLGFLAAQWYEYVNPQGELSVDDMMDRLLPDFLPPTILEPRFKTDPERFVPSRCFNCIKMEHYNMRHIIYYGLKTNKPFFLIMKALLALVTHIPDEELSTLYNYEDYRGDVFKAMKWFFLQNDYAIAYLMDKSPTWGGRFYGPGWRRHWPNDRDEVDGTFRLERDIGRPRWEGPRGWFHGWVGAEAYWKKSILGKWQKLAGDTEGAPRNPVITAQLEQMGLDFTRNLRNPRG